jgi:hypothetical protein
MADRLLSLELSGLYVTTLLMTVPDEAVASSGLRRAHNQGDG